MVIGEQVVYVVTVLLLALGVVGLYMTVTHPRKWARQSLYQSAVSLVISIGLFLGTTVIGLSVLTILGVL